MVCVDIIKKAIVELEEESKKKGIAYKFNAFKMHYVDGKTYEEIAEELNCGKNSPANWNKAMLRRMTIKLFGVRGTI